MRLAFTTVGWRETVFGAGRKFSVYDALVGLAAVFFTNSDLGQTGLGNLTSKAAPLTMTEILAAGAFPHGQTKRIGLFPLADLRP